MSIAIWGLIGLTLLILVHVSVDSFMLKGSVGNAWTIGPRDTPPNVGPIAARAHRALWNLLETAPAFIALALVAELTAKSGVWITWGVALYLGGRTAYLPAYLSGLPWVRTVFWQVSMIGIIALLIGVIWGG